MADSDKSSSFLSTAASVASAVSSPVASILNYFGNKSLNEERNRIAIEQWNRENEYNLPSNQVQRLKDAGLNPALMYENGASGLVSAASPDMTSSTANFQGVDPLTAAQIRNLDAQTQSVEDKNARENELQPLNVQNLRANNNVLAQKVKNMTAEEQVLYVEQSLKQSQLAFTDMQTSELKKLWNSQIGLNKSLQLKNDEECRQLVALYNLKRQGIILSNREIQSRIGCNEAQANVFIKQLQLMDSQISLNYASRENIISEASVRNARAPYQMVLDQMSASMQYYQARFLKLRADDPFSYGSKIGAALKSGHNLGKNFSNKFLSIFD